MIKYLILTASIVLCTCSLPVLAQNNEAPFTSLVSTTTPHSVTAKLISFTGSTSQNKIMIDWTVENNQAANLFEVEKSYDGKNFRLAAIVFGTDQAAANSYQFYEKKSSKKVYYRISILNKNEVTEYAEPIVIIPSN